MGYEDAGVDEFIAPVTTVATRRVGLLSDEPNATDYGGTLPAEVIASFVTTPGCCRPSPAPPPRLPLRQRLDF